MRLIWSDARSMCFVFMTVALPDTPRAPQTGWEEQGYAFVRFGEARANWAPAFVKLTKLLG
ncbi:MAG TPA: hypothetical protein PKE41_05380 [Candidatus Macondimonas sp.]|nr:hypothetical protein [Candidatus Macondimonas sp.]